MRSWCMKSKRIDYPTPCIFLHDFSYTPFFFKKKFCHLLQYMEKCLQTGVHGVYCADDKYRSFAIQRRLAKHNDDGIVRNIYITH